MCRAPLPPAVDRYLSSRGASGPWTIEGTARSDFAGAVVIPALAEGASLFATLASLAANPPELLERFLVLVVVNHRPDADPADKADNLALLRHLASGDVPAGLHLAWVDAASPGRELPARDGGVGLARKIGLDLALSRLGHAGVPILVSLDADTLVDRDYLPALASHFATAREGGAVLPFAHRPGSTAAGEAAIGRYELFLRHYVLGLSLAGSPYAFHTVGSALACSASAYAKAGGMNRRRAGEDFYFLQQLAKTAGVRQVQGTVVYPSPRPSGRTPFGTGRSVSRLLAGEEGAVRFYQPECFRILGAWLSLAAACWQTPGAAVLDAARGISGHLAEHLEGIGLPAVWGRLQRNHRQEGAFQDAFHRWFDGLRTLRLIHSLCAGPLPKVGPEQALAGLLHWAGLEPAADPARQLALLRAHQGTVPSRAPSAAGLCMLC